MSKLLIIPDIHGRTFWKKPCEHSEDYEKIVFLGDYLDPYNFEFISVEQAIENFKEIIQFKKDNNDKVILLLGNHDMPYAFEDYFNFSSYHCRHSKLFHQDISKIFSENKNLFQIAYCFDDILFTHAGVEHGWIENVVKCTSTDINETCNVLNSLTDTKEGLDKLFKISDRRGGIDRYPSCIWSDLNDIGLDSVNNEEEVEKIKHPIWLFKQVYGHTIQAFYNSDGDIVFGNAVEFGNYKMVDTASAYSLDTKTFNIKKL